MINRRGLKIICDIDAVNIESILQCGHKFDIAKSFIIMGIKVVRSTVSHWDHTEP